MEVAVSGSRRVKRIRARDAHEAKAAAERSAG